MAGEAPTADAPSEEGKEVAQAGAEEQDGYEDDPVDESGWIDLFSGKIKARLLKEGSGTVPELKQDVICTYEVRTFADADAATPLQIYKESRVRVGEGDCPPAVELGLRRMKEGEVCELFSIANMAWGPGGRPAVGPEEKEVPGDVDLHFRVELHKCVTPDTSFTAMADEMMWRKSSGTDYFRRKDFQRARRAYRAALDVYKNMGPPPEDLGDQREAEAERLDNLAADCGANLAAVHLELGDTPLAKDAATSALEVNPNHPKALYRAAKAALLLHDHEECDLALKRLEELQPDDAGVRKVRADLRRAQQQYAAKSKKFAAKLWEGPREGYEERQAKKADEDGANEEEEGEADGDEDDDDEESGGEEEAENAEPEDTAAARAKAKTTFTRLLNSVLAVVCGSLAVFAYVVWVSRRRQGGWQIPLVVFIALMAIVSITCIAREVLGIGFKAPEVVDAKKKND